MSRRWTLQERAKLVAEFDKPSIDIEEVARKFGRSPRECASMAQRLGYSSKAIWAKVHALEAANTNVEPVEGNPDAPTFARKMCGPNNRHEVIEIRPANRPGWLARLWARFVAAEPDSDRGMK